MISKPKNFLPFFIVLLVSSFIFLYQLGSRSLANWDEAWYADASRFMFRHDHFMTPIWNGQFFFDKPPLQYWLTQPLLHLFGETEIAYRLPSALACIGVALLTYLWAKRRSGILGGLAASLVLLSFPHFIDRGRSGNFDGLFILWTTLSLFLFQRQRPLLGGVVLGFSWMTKGVFSGLFPVFVIGFFSLKEIILVRKISLLKKLLVYASAAAAIYLPWYLIEINRFEELIQKSYFASLDQGTFGSTSWFDIVWRFDLRYLVFLWTFLRFWFPILLFAVISKALQLNKLLVLAQKNRNWGDAGGAPGNNSSHREFWSGVQPSGRTPIENFLPLAVFLIVFIALSAAREKNDWYIMPVYPFAAILISEFTFSMLRNKRKLALILITVVALINFIVYRRQSFPLDNHLSEKQVAQLVKSLTSENDLVVTAEYEFPTLIYYSERQARTATRQPDYEGKYWWIWDNIDIEKALQKGQSIVTIHRPGTEWSIDVPGFRREKMAELSGRIISRVVASP